VASKCGCDGAIAISTSDFSRKIFDSVGMATVKSRDWDSFKVNGEKIYAHKVESSHCASHFIKLN
jgi:hypothetical protein